MFRLRTGQCAVMPLFSRNDVQVEHLSQQAKPKRWLSKCPSGEVFTAEVPFIAIPLHFASWGMQAWLVTALISPLPG